MCPQDYGIPLNEIAFQVGDTHNTVQKLFQGMMVIEQAEKEKIFSRDDIKKNRLYFSHLYTALQYEGFKDFLSIGDAIMESSSPVPAEKIKNLEELLKWLYGSKKDSIDPVIKSQNPDLRRLESIVKDREAIMALRAGSTLEASFELSLPKSIVFEESLYAAKRELQKAWSYVNEGYKGDDELLTTARSISNLSNELYSKVRDMNEKKSRPSKKD